MTWAIAPAKLCLVDTSHHRNRRYRAVLELTIGTGRVAYGNWFFSAMATPATAAAEALGPAAVIRTT